MGYKYILSKSACNKIESKNLPYVWELNIYRGCEHSCIYCFAQYTSNYLNSDFNKDIYIKKNIVELFKKFLESNKYKQDLINLGGITDSYQYIERHLKIMPQILDLLIRYKAPCTISTKSSLILRDYNLYEILSKNTYVNIAITITTLNEVIQKQFEPNASSIKDRMYILKEFSKLKIRKGIHIMPIMPYINDDINSLESIFIIAKNLKVDYVDTEVLNLYGQTKISFYKCLNKYYPSLIKRYDKIYFNGKLSNLYIENINKRLDYLRKKYNFPLVERKQLQNFSSSKQLSFLDLNF